MVFSYDVGHMLGLMYAMYACSINVQLPLRYENGLLNTEPPFTHPFQKA